MVISKFSPFLPLLMLLAMGWMTAEYAQEQPAASRDQQLKDLAEAERAFAATTVKEGFRDGFIKFFADDGIGFGPHPQRTREELMKSPPASGPRKVIFNWSPMFGDISAAGDLGYTTGPVLFTDITANPKPPWHGMYFSVWEKRADSTWKVAVDMGIDTPEAVVPIGTKFTAVKPVNRDRKLILSNANMADLSNLDISFSRSIAEHSMAKTYAKLLEREQFRIHRKGQMPIVSENDLIKFLKSVDGFEFIGGKVSLSNDLAFTYGKYFSAVGGAESETGYYVHVWRRDAVGKWRLVADVQNPLPKENK